MIPIPEGNTTLALAMQYRLQQTQSVNVSAANQLREQSLQALLIARGPQIEPTR